MKKVYKVSAEYDEYGDCIDETPVIFPTKEMANDYIKRMKLKEIKSEEKRNNLLCSIERCKKVIIGCNELLSLHFDHFLKLICEDGDYESYAKLMEKECKLLSIEIKGTKQKPYCIKYFTIKYDGVLVHMFSNHIIQNNFTNDQIDHIKKCIEIRLNDIKKCQELLQMIDGDENAIDLDKFETKYDGLEIEEIPFIES